MTVNATTTISVAQAADGLNRNWYFPFKIVDEEQIVLYLLDPNSVETRVSTGYSVVGVGSDNGGQVTYPLAPLDPLPSGTTVKVGRLVVYEQPDRLGNQGPYLPRIHEGAFDRLEMQIQQIAEKTSRALLTSVFSPPGTVTLPPADPGHVLIWDENGDLANSATDVANFETSAINAQAAAEIAMAMAASASDAAAAAAGAAGAAVAVNATLYFNSRTAAAETAALGGIPVGINIIRVASGTADDDGLQRQYVHAVEESGPDWFPDLNGGYWVWAPEKTVIPLGYAARSKEARAGELPNVEDWRGYGGDPSDTAAIQAAVNAATGVLCINAGVFTLEDTITITRNDVTLIGQGEGGHQNSAAAVRASAATRLVATTAQPMVLFTPVEGGPGGRGGGIRRIMLDGMNLATRCLEIRSWRGLRVEDMHLFAATQDMLFTGAFTGTLTSVYVVMWCYFNNVQAHAKQQGGTAYPLRLTGGQGAGGTAGGNTCYCTFQNCMFLANDQDGILLEDTDSNTFISVNGAYDGPGSHYGLVLGSADQDSSNHTPTKSAARYNTFIGGTYGGSLQGGVYARASQVGGGSSFRNCFYGKTTSNAEPNPTCEVGAGGSADGSVVVYSNDGMEASAVNVGAFSSAQTLNSFSGVTIISAETANRAITLPKAAHFMAGKTQLLYIGRSDVSSNFVSISAQGADTVNGLTTINIGPGPGVILWSDGVSRWFSAGSPITRNGLLDQATEAGITLAPWTSPYHTKYSATQTAIRTVTLATTGAVRGMSFRITRTGGGAPALNIGTGPLKALATNQWCEVAYDGSAWYLAAFGSL